MPGGPKGRCKTDRSVSPTSIFPKANRQFIVCTIKGNVHRMWRPPVAEVVRLPPRAGRKSDDFRHRPPRKAGCNWVGTGLPSGFHISDHSTDQAPVQKQHRLRKQSAARWQPAEVTAAVASVATAAADPHESPAIAAEVAEPVPVAVSVVAEAVPVAPTLPPPRPTIGHVARPANRQSRIAFSLAFSCSFLMSSGDSLGRSIDSVILWILPLNLNGAL